jgi:PilZ domain
MKERRTSKRHNTKLSAEYIFARSGGKIKKKGKGVIKDISYGGAKLEAEVMLDDSPFFLIEIKSDKHKVNTAGVGRVTWIKNKKGTSRCGIKIDWLSNKKDYKKYITALEKK